MNFKIIFLCSSLSLLCVCLVFDPRSEQNCFLSNNEIKRWIKQRRRWNYILKEWISFHLLLCWRYSFWLSFHLLLCLIHLLISLLDKNNFLSLGIKHEILNPIILYFVLCLILLLIWLNSFLVLLCKDISYSGFELMTSWLSLLT